MKFINKYLRNLAPYKVASHKIWDVAAEQKKNILKLDWNEATVPPSPLVKQRLATLVEDETIYYLYPSTHNKTLIELLSAYCNLPTGNIQYFASSDALHEYLVRVFVNVGDPILILGPTYDNFRLTCESQGAQIFYFNYSSDFKLNEVDFKKKIQSTDPSLVYICNPNNPTGNLLSRNYLLDLISSFPDTIFLIDEAYYEFSGNTLAQDVNNFDNLFISRTFSKAFALANFRAGYLLSDESNIKQVSKIRNPKNFTTFTQEAVIAVLSDLDYMKKYVKEVKDAKQIFTNSVQNLESVKCVYESHGNFVLIEFISQDAKMICYNALFDADIFVRNLTHSEELYNTLRITIGTIAQMDYVYNVMIKTNK